MQVVYSFIYYFTFFFVLLCLALLVFILPPMRSLLYLLKQRITALVQSEFIRYAIYFVFAIILIILIESLFTYTVLNSTFKTSTPSPTQKIDTIRSPPAWRNSTSCPQIIVRTT